MIPMPGMHQCINAFKLPNCCITPNGFTFFNFYTYILLHFFVNAFAYHPYNLRTVYMIFRSETDLISLLILLFFTFFLSLGDPHLKKHKDPSFQIG